MSPVGGKHGEDARIIEEALLLLGTTPSSFAREALDRLTAALEAAEADARQVATEALRVCELGVPPASLDSLAAMARAALGRA